MISLRAFEVLVSIITGSRERETREHRDFLEFYKNLVSIVPEDVAKDFGSVKVPTVIRGVLQEGYRLELTVTDYLWWQTIIDGEGGRFALGVLSVQRDVWDHLNKQVREGALTNEERMNLMSLLKSDEA